MMSNDGKRGLCLISWNVKGLNNPAKRKKCLSFLKSKNCDIAFLQETHLPLGEERKLRVGWVSHTLVSCGTSKSRGVAILVKKGSHFKCIKENRDDAGRLLLMLAEIQGFSVILVNVYAPNVHDPSFFGEIERRVGEMGNFPIIMAGDYNQAMDDFLDRKPPSVSRRPSANSLKAMCEDLGLADIWRIQNPSASDFTSWSPRQGSPP